jgi:hypothetical protein
VVSGAVLLVGEQLAGVVVLGAALRWYGRRR